MSKRIFRQKQLEILKTNPHILSVSEKYITYTDTFKQNAVDQYLKEYIPPRDIFIQAGFDIDIIGADTPHRCIDRWLRSGTTSHTKGRKKNYDDKDIEIAYLRAENAFLKKLRAQRAER